MHWQRTEPVGLSGHKANHCVSSQAIAPKKNILYHVQNNLPARRSTGKYSRHRVSSTLPVRYYQRIPFNFLVQNALHYVDTVRALFNEVELSVLCSAPQYIAATQSRRISPVMFELGAL